MQYHPLSCITFVVTSHMAIVAIILLLQIQALCVWAI